MDRGYKLLRIESPVHYQIEDVLDVFEACFLLRFLI